VRRDNFNRDSSSVQSAAGFVIHSGVHRSTAFISKTDHADCWHAFTYWRQQGQAAINAFVEAIIDGSDLATAESNAFHATRQDWRVTVKKTKQAFAGGDELTAWRKSGRLRSSVSAYTWRHLHARTGGES
jgi:hypothetical protein